MIFWRSARALAELVAASAPNDVAALSAMALDGATVEDRRQKLVQKIGENISIRRFERMQTGARLALYTHGAKIGVIVDYQGPDEVGKDLAMHIAFAKPQYLTKSDAPPDVVARERDILSARAMESGKTVGDRRQDDRRGINKFLGEISLLGQAFVKDDKQTVEKMLAARKAKVLGYRFFVVGEGIERKTTDFCG